MWYLGSSPSSLGHILTQSSWGEGSSREVLGLLQCCNLPPLGVWGKERKGEMMLPKGRGRRLTPACSCPKAREQRALRLPPSLHPKHCHSTQGCQRHPRLRVPVPSKGLCQEQGSGCCGRG